MSYPGLRAARRGAAVFCALFALASCADMGAGTDPRETEGSFLLSLPPSLRPSEIRPKPPGPAPDGLEAAEGDGEALPPQAQDEAPKESPDEVASDGGGTAPESAPALANGSLADAAPLEEGIPVSRYSLYMVSALGYKINEEIEPSEEPSRIEAQAGTWKISVVAEGLEGGALARCELSGVALSAGDEAPLALEWEAP